MKNIETEIRELETGGQLAIIYLDNPETRNSMTLDMGLAFNGELQRIASLHPHPRAMVVTGKNNVFSSGGDFDLLKTFGDNTPEHNKEFMNSFYRLFLAVRSMPFPVVAAVNGHAFGAALSLALACDIRYFTPDGKYSVNFVKLAIHPGMGSSFLLKEVVGMTQAQDLLLTGKIVTGEEAFRRGLCQDIFPKESILEKAIETAEEIARNAPQAVRQCKRGLYLNDTLEKTLLYEAESQAQNFMSADYQEAMEAVISKRPPLFKDE